MNYQEEKDLLDVEKDCDLARRLDAATKRFTTAFERTKEAFKSFTDAVEEHDPHHEHDLARAEGEGRVGQ